MRLKPSISFKGAFGLILGLSLLFQGLAFAQTDTSKNDTVGSAPVETTTEVADSSSNDSTALEKVADAEIAPAAKKEAAAAAAPEIDEGLPAQVYINFFFYVMMFVLVCLIVAVIGKIMAIYGLTRQLQGYKSHAIWGKSQGWFFLIALFVFLYGIYWSYVHHGSQSFREAATVHGAKIDNMFIVTVVLTTIVLVLTHIALFGFAFRYRGSEKRKAYFYPHNNLLEKIWTIVPAITLAVLVLFGFFSWREITNIPPEEQKSALQIEVTGQQFQWYVRYGGRDNQIGKHDYKLTTPINSLGIDFNDKAALDDMRAGDIVIPVGKPVRFTINSKDVLHSFFIPEFRVQINAVPGMPTYFQFVPKYTTEERRAKLNDPDYDYILLCAKICGSGHYNMQKTVKVVTEEEYKQWLSEQSYFFEGDMIKEFKSAQQKDEADKNLTALNY